MDNSSALTGYGPKVEPQANRLLGALTAADLRRWQPHLESIDMPVGMSLRRWGEYRGHVYFPSTASVSMLHLTRAGASVEVVAVGNEGLVGIPVILGGEPAAGDAVVRTAGRGFRLDSAWLVSEFQTCAAVMALLLRYAHALMTHTAQSAACLRHHSLDQRLCRCLLSSLDSANGAALNLTHESLAGMLGVRREGVTGSALKLQRAGYIDYARGHIRVTHRSALEALSCECYRVVKAAYEPVTAGPSRIDGGLSGHQPPATEMAMQRAGAAPSSAGLHRAHSTISAMAG